MAYVDLNNKLDWALSFQRTGKFPLDRSSMFSSYADALDYAKQDGTDDRGLGGTSYIGQIITVYGPGQDGSTEEVAAYVITAVGSGAALTKLAATTASGDLAADVAQLQSQVGQLQTSVGDLEDKDSPSRTEFTTLNSQVTTNTEGLTEADSRISVLETKIEGLTGAMHFVGTSTTDPSTGTVTIEDKPDYQAAAGDIVLYGSKEYIYDGTQWTEFGDEGSHLTQGQADARYVQLTAYNSQISALQTKDTELDGKITTLETAGYITETVADGKYVAQEDGKSLVNDTLITKLTNSVEIDSVNAAEFTIGSEDKELSINAIEQSKVTGLVSALQNKADDADVTALGERVTAIEGQEDTWNAKYDKPASGIPLTDLTTSVQASLALADSALQSVPQATEEVLGGIKATAKTAADTGYTQEVKIDATTGKLYAQAPELPSVDTSMSDSSTNAVQNKVIKAYVDAETTRAKAAEQALSTRVTAIEDKEATWDAKYTKPASGIPSTDLASAVQTTLGNVATNTSAIETLQEANTQLDSRLDTIEGQLPNFITYEEIV